MERIKGGQKRNAFSTLSLLSSESLLYFSVPPWL
jgi:hypothetical protein